MVQIIGRSGFASSRGQIVGPSASGTMVLVRLADGPLAGDVVPFYSSELRPAAMGGAS